MAWQLTGKLSGGLASRGQAFRDADHPRRGNVVPLRRLGNGQSLSPLHQAEAYWTAIGGPGTVPRRSDLDPRGLGNILDQTFLLERIAPGLARVRLAGRALHALAGMDLRGMPLSALFEAGARPEITNALRGVFDRPAVAHLSLTLGQGRGRSGQSAGMILLPLRDEDGRVSRALGVLAVENDPTPHPPCRFGITGSQVRDVVPARPDRAPMQFRNLRLVASKAQ